MRVENSIQSLGFLLIEVRIKTVLCGKSSSIATHSWCRQFVLNCRHHGNIISKTVKVKICWTVNWKLSENPRVYRPIWGTERYEKGNHGGARYHDHPWVAEALRWVDTLL